MNTLKPLIYTERQLIKKLKLDGNFNEDFVSKMGFCDDYIWKRGNYKDSEDLYYKDQDKLIYKFDNIRYNIIVSFDPVKDWKAKKEQLIILCDYIKSYEIESEAVCKLVEKLSKDMTPEEINMTSKGNITYETNAEEHISISTHASVWSYYIKGKIEVNNRVFESDWVNYKTVVNRL